ncbi:MAG: hypothetical protein HY741_08115 [Chloroflexi bacterium]|nr:hypothetical protein [Chloroflexota bacterium]
MLYPLFIALLTGGLYAASAWAVNSNLALFAGMVAGVLMFLAIYLPRHFFQYHLEDLAPTVLQRLMQRAVIGTGLVLAIPLLVLAMLGVWTNPVLLGELYVYALIGVFLFQGIGEVITNHVLYLQRTNQYNSNQLFAMLSGIALLIFVLILYFLAFDLAQPPQLHNYVRDLLAITLVLSGYGRAVFLMAHH